MSSAFVFLHVKQYEGMWDVIKRKKVTIKDVEPGFAQQTRKCKATVEEASEWIRAELWTKNKQT
uniref:Uncharacterized protein n=1 Tax=Romanomermis culicivorax TaxID=13658 RepID=A0A915KPE0_ROMCU